MILDYTHVSRNINHHNINVPHHHRRKFRRSSSRLNRVLDHTFPVHTIRRCQIRVRSKPRRSLTLSPIPKQGCVR